MFKMGSHDLFGYLKHKLRPKERLEVKLPIWLPTTKNWESPWFAYVPHTIGKLLTKAINLLQSPKSPTHKVMGLQSCGNPNFENLGVGPMARHREYYKRKVVASPKSGLWGVLWVHVCLWLVCALKMFHYALTNLLFGLCRSVWIIDALVIRPSPILKLQHTPLPPKCYELGSMPQLLLLPMSSPLNS
jgi:hypothetical protein